MFNSTHTLFGPIPFLVGLKDIISTLLQTAVIK